MGVLSNLWDALITGIRGLWEMCLKVVRAVIDFFADILDWFKAFFNGPDSDKKDAVVIDLPKLIDDAKRQGHVVDLNIKSGSVAAAIYDHETCKITQLKSIDSDRRDDQTKEILAGRKLVIVE